MILVLRSSVLWVLCDLTEEIGRYFVGARVVGRVFVGIPRIENMMWASPESVGVDGLLDRRETLTPP